MGRVAVVAAICATPATFVVVVAGVATASMRGLRNRRDDDTDCRSAVLPGDESNDTRAFRNSPLQFSLRATTRMTHSPCTFVVPEEGSRAAVCRPEVVAEPATSCL